MKRLDTLRAYDDMVATGMLPNDARASLNVIMESHDTLSENLIEKFKSLKGEFASNKLMTLFGTLILTIGGFTLNKVIDIDSRVLVLESKFEILTHSYGR